MLGFEHQQKQQAEGTSGMHAVAWVPVLLCSLCALPARKEQGKARTSSSKGERERGKAAKDKQRKQFDSSTAASFACIGAKHVAQSKQIAREKQIASSKQSTKHDVVRRTLSKQSTKYVDELEAKHDAIEAKHDAEAKQLGGVTPSCILQGSQALPFFLPRTPPRTLVSTSHRRRPCYSYTSPCYSAPRGAIWSHLRRPVSLD